jgi:hypothetical protein
MGNLRRATAEDATPALTVRERRSTPLLIAGMLFAAGLLLLLWPVSTDIRFDGQFVPQGGSGANTCGTAISQALRTPRGPDDPRADRTLDCASRARDRVGYAALFLLLAVPPTVIAIDDRLRTRHVS